MDELAAYHDEIRAIEDAWFQEQARIENPLERASGSLWTRDWVRLREIWERHGIGAGDPRVFSIASFRCEDKMIQDRWDHDCEEQARLYRANPEVDSSFGWSTSEYHNHELNCSTRHFPGLDYQNPEATADTIPKAWWFITESLRIADLHKMTTLGREILDEVSLKRAEETYTILLRLQVGWAPDPTNRPRDFTGKRYRDHLHFIANRLEREEAESLPPEFRRAFAAGSLECARLERMAPNFSLPGSHPLDQATVARPGMVQSLSIEEELIETLRRAKKSKQANLVEFMSNRTSADFQEVADRVYGDDMTEENTIRQLVKRTNDSHIESGSSIRYRVASGRVFKDIAPE